MHTPTDRETGAFLQVLALRTLLALAVGAVAAAVVLWARDTDPTGVAVAIGVWVALIAAFPITFVVPSVSSRPLPHGLLRHRWRLAVAVRRHEHGRRRSITAWPPHSPAWSAHTTLLAGMVAGARGRPRDQERILDAARRVVATGGDLAGDTSCPQGRARLSAYTIVFDALEALHRPAESEPYAWAAVAEFGDRARVPLSRTATRAVVLAAWRARWAAGERTLELARCLLLATENEPWREEFLREAVTAGLPLRLLLVRMPAVPPEERESIARAGLTTEPELLGELVGWLGRADRLDEAIILAHDEQLRGNPLASGQLGRAGSWRHHGRDPGLRAPAGSRSSAPGWSGGSFSQQGIWSVSDTAATASFLAAGSFGSSSGPGAGI